nr:MAG TPA: hypothetical protein [Caudoviricetes sp.]
MGVGFLCCAADVAGRMWRSGGLFCQGPFFLCYNLGILM